MLRLAGRAENAIVRGRWLGAMAAAWAVFAVSAGHGSASDHRRPRAAPNSPKGQAGARCRSSGALRVRRCLRGVERAWTRRRELQVQSAVSVATYRLAARTRQATASSRS